MYCFYFLIKLKTGYLLSPSPTVTPIALIDIGVRLYSIKPRKLSPAIFFMKDNTILLGHDVGQHGNGVLNLAPGELFGFNTGDWKTVTAEDLASPQ
jgi:hypothetical protein